MLGTPTCGTVVSTVSGHGQDRSATGGTPVPQIRYFRVPEDWRKEQKLQDLNRLCAASKVPWATLKPDTSGLWLVPERAEEFQAFVPLGNKVAKAADSGNPQTVFKVFSGGVKTNRDEVTYDFDRTVLANRIRQFVDDYNGEVDRYKRSGGTGVPPVDDFVRYDKIKWSRDLKLDLKRGNYAVFNGAKIRVAIYRPFCRRYLFFDRILNEEVYVNPSIFPTPAVEGENLVIWTKAGMDWPFFALASDRLVDVLPQGGSQCFPFYLYDEDGTNRRENITDWALEHFRKHYSDSEINKWDIFHYVYGVLHHPEYRSKYAENLKRELPRIPLVGSGTGVPPVSSHGQDSHATSSFWAFANAGKELAQLHVDYEKLEPYPLKYVETCAVAAVYDRRPLHEKNGAHRAPLQQPLPLSYRVEDKMRLSKDRTSLKVNDSLTLAGIPPEVFEYRLGNRSALEWVIDQYQVTEDKRSGIRSDPNRPDDPEYIVRLAAQAVRVSLETVRIVDSLPAL